MENFRGKIGVWKERGDEKYGAGEGMKGCAS
jgi:hypothetical protein